MSPDPIIGGGLAGRYAAQSAEVDPRQAQRFEPAVAERPQTITEPADEVADDRRRIGEADVAPRARDAVDTRALGDRLDAIEQAASRIQDQRERVGDTRQQALVEQQAAGPNTLTEDPRDAEPESDEPVADGSEPLVGPRFDAVPDEVLAPVEGTTTISDEAIAREQAAFEPVPVGQLGIAERSEPEVDAAPPPVRTSLAAGGQGQLTQLEQLQADVTAAVEAAGPEDAETPPPRDPEAATRLAEQVAVQVDQEPLRAAYGQSGISADVAARLLA